MKTKITLISCVCMLCFLQLGTAQAISLTSSVDFDDVTSTYSYNYTVQNDATPDDEIWIDSFIFPFFGDQDLALINSSIVTPEYWSYAIIETSSSSWPYISVDDPDFSTYTPSGADYRSPDYVLSFFLDYDALPSLITLMSVVDHAQMQIAICNISGKCSEEDYQSYLDAINTLDQYNDAFIYGGEVLGGFAFDSLLGPTDGPVILTTTDGITEGIAYIAADLPYTYGLVPDSPNDTGATPVPEPATMLLLGAGLVSLAGTYRRNAHRVTHQRSGQEKKQLPV